MSHRIAKAGAILTLLTGAVCVPSLARAQSAYQTPRNLELMEFKLDGHPGWSVGLEGYAGIAVESGADGTRGHGIAGGLSRFRINYVEFGGELQVSDLAIERWNQLGGFVGAYFPITNWVDFDTSIGIAQRTYLNSDTRYGPGGMDLHSGTFTYRLAFSDRVLDSTFGLRLGGAFLVGVDLVHHDVPWTYTDGRQVATGITKVGGVTFGLVATVGFDVAFRRGPQPIGDVRQ